MSIRALIFLLGAFGVFGVVDAFAPRSVIPRGKKCRQCSAHELRWSGGITPAASRSSRSQSTRRSLPLKLSSGGNNSFDISKPTFDLYTFRSIRGDALLRYNSLNQSEPLRINLYLLLMAALFSYPAISEAVVGEQATLVGTAASTLGGAFAAYRFVRECGRRSRKLSRMEKELNAELLTVKLPNNRFADRPYGDAPPISVRQLRGNRRILALCGTADQLREAMVPFRTLRRRFVQASVLVVAVPTDGSSANDWGISAKELRSVPYLAQTVDASEWVDYINSLLSDKEDSSDDMLQGKLAWFGLTNTGKSFGSGIGSPPRIIEILGQSLLPIEFLDETDEAENIAANPKAGGLEDILSAQRAFYDALVGGDLSGIQMIFDADNSEDVDEVIDGGGSIDGWETCLEDGARPSGMQFSGSDVLLVSDTEAYSTAIEFPSVAGFDTASLLAVQKWGRSAAGGQWKLQLHQTIPWGPDSKAGATLRCDCRGCTALASGPMRQWNFRGMID